MSAELLDLEQVRARIAEAHDRELAQEAEDVAATFNYIRTMRDHGESLIDFAQNPEGRFMTGLPELDIMLRGFGRRELHFLIGRPHTGKTQLALTAMSHNYDRRIIFFSFDESAEHVLAKLIAMQTGLGFEDLERRLKNDDPEALDIVRRATNDHFRNLVVVDNPMRLNQMADALNEAQQYWGGKADLVVIDHAKKVKGHNTASPEGMDATTRGVSNLAKNFEVPILLLHQQGRGDRSRGKPPAMEDMKYGGEDDAFSVVGVFRKREDESLLGMDRKRHENTISVYVSKNKRPPSKKGEVDFYMEPSTGQIRPLREEDTLLPGDPIPNAQVALAARRSFQ